MSKLNTKDISASLGLFLVAMPLCLAVAIASGVDPIKGVFTGIIGGILVGIFSGSPLQVSGPSAGLAVMVFHVVEQYGVQALIPLGIIVGLFQIATAVFKVGHFFQATPPALLKAMISGIGAVIAISQTYLLFEMKMSSNGLQNLFGLPTLFTPLFTGALSTSQVQSLTIGAVVIGILVLWSKGKHKIFETIPGALISTLVGGAMVYFFGYEVKMINLPDNPLQGALSFDYFAAFSSVDLGFYAYAVGFAFVASAETLLCVSAVDKMAGTKSNYNKQILSQGVGNIATGLIGAIPVVGVLSRSAVNVEFGAKTRLSNILHGVFISVFLIFPRVLDFIPIPALAGLLIYISFKLLDLPHIINYVKKFNKTSWIFLVTFALTICVDLLVGVMAGFLTSILILVFDILKFDLQVVEEGENKVLKFRGKLSFLDLPVISKKLEGQELGDVNNLEICLREVEYLDPAIDEHFTDLKKRLEAKGAKIKINVGD